jgi:hypothetical protein
LWTPLIYDSIGHGSQRGAHVVHNIGVSSEIDRAVADATTQPKSRARIFPLKASDIQQTSPNSIIDMPMVFRTSTRNKSVHGAHPQAITYSCKRNKNPSARISAPRRIVVLAMEAEDVPFCLNLSTTRATEIPAKKRNKGAGKVPPNCDHIKKVDFFALPLSHAS